MILHTFVILSDDILMNQSPILSIKCEQRGVVFTARIRRMEEGTVFSLFVSSHLDIGVPQPGVDGWGGYPGQVWMVGGYPARSRWWGRVPQPGLDGRGYPSQVWMVGGRYPSQIWMVGGYPGQVWMVGGTWGTTPLARSGWGNPPHHDWMGYPSWLDEVPPTMTEWGTPHNWMGYPPPWLDGVPPPWLDEVPPPTNIASTCYTAGGMPRAFTQEDFLVIFGSYHDLQAWILLLNFYFAFKV